MAEFKRRTDGTLGLLSSTGPLIKKREKIEKAEELRGTAHDLKKPRPSRFPPDVDPEPNPSVPDFEDDGKPPF